MGFEKYLQEGKMKTIKDPKQAAIDWLDGILSGDWEIEFIPTFKKSKPWHIKLQTARNDKYPNLEFEIKLIGAKQIGIGK